MNSSSWSKATRMSLKRLGEGEKENFAFRLLSLDFDSFDPFKTRAELAIGAIQHCHKVRIDPSRRNVSPNGSPTSRPISTASIPIG